jgi:ATP adenylyltransferase
LDYLFSPWRMEYIENHLKANGCVFCFEQEKSDGSENLIVTRGQKAFVILNRYPYTSGHIMTVPHIHKSTLEDLDPETRAEMLELATIGMRVLRRIYNPQGFNVGVNIGEAAGAGITEHVHLHVVPRWMGDTNFMTSLGKTRVLPENLEKTYKRVCEEWGRVGE